jgi:hypothetical protein
MHIKNYQGFPNPHLMGGKEKTKQRKYRTHYNHVLLVMEIVILYLNWRRKVESTTLVVLI